MSGEPRAATGSDLDGVTATLTAAFATDPLWSWAFPDPADLAVWWRYHIASALRYPWVWISGDYAAAAVWIPPDGVELSEEEEAGVMPLARDLIGSRSDDVLELLNRFEASHPREEPHYYLSLLGTRPDRRGMGLGMALLADNLRRTDAEGIPTFLESSNPANNVRYERLGFTQVGEFTTPDEARTVATMWREVGAGGPAEQEMSTPSVTAVEEAYEALANGGLDSFLAHWTDDLDHRSIEGAPDDRGPIHGRDAMRSYLQDWIDTFDGFRIAPVELIDAGRGVVIGVLRYGGRAKLSGIETDDTFGVVFTVDDGRIARGREYSTRDQALEAAGGRE